MSAKNQKGRSKSGATFISIYHYVYDSPAWASLSATECMVFLALCRRYNGKNNGWIGLGVRDAAREAKVNKDTAGKHFTVLEDRGFIECAEEASFDRKTKRAREWRLTHHKCDRTHQLPSKAFQRWTPPEVVEGEPKAARGVKPRPVAPTKKAA